MPGVLDHLRSYRDRHPDEFPTRTTATTTIDVPPTPVPVVTPKPAAARKAGSRTLRDRMATSQAEMVERLTRDVGPKDKTGFDPETFAPVDTEPMRPNQRGLAWRLIIELREFNPGAAKLLGDLLTEREKTMLKVECSAFIDGIRRWIAKGPAGYIPLPDVPAPTVAAGVATPPVQPVAEGRKPRDTFDDIPDGNYALDVPGDKIHFYRVSRKEVQGSRGGTYMRIKVQERASDELHYMPWVRQQRTMNAIREAGPKAAAHLFATKLERCYACGRSLTDEESRTAMIGPDCRDQGRAFA